MAFESEVDRALHRRGDPMSAHDFLAVLEEVTSIAAEPLTSGEHDFLMENTDLEESELSPEGRVTTNMRVLVGQARSRVVLKENSLSTAEVAALLGRDPANIRRSRLEGALYSPGSGVPGQSLRFPRWQFVDGAQVPGLRKVIPAFPAHFHPLSIERFMLTANKNLEDMPPVAWLALGGNPEAVATLADELGYE
ncbi:hypothetical protein [Glutamicibacter sp.]|uniref:hypothetical protein n=1 Tax=Glutamicibacter sp. TaxID=1931995 RepID=UPI002B463C35|nr:hypothetical protein [Glutamicibacter sp.]HJX78121.1 hypothetical protein [Glutamicibacter sp.]